MTLRERLRGRLVNSALWAKIKAIDLKHKKIGYLVNQYWPVLHFLYLHSFHSRGNRGLPKDRQGQSKDYSADWSACGNSGHRDTGAHWGTHLRYQAKASIRIWALLAGSRRVDAGHQPRCQDLFPGLGAGVLRGQENSLGNEIGQSAGFCKLDS